MGPLDMRFIYITLVIVAAKAVDSIDLPSCLDEDGKPVDWFIAYKFPDLSEQVEPFNTGYAYAYITSDSIKTKSPSFRSRAEDSMEQSATNARTILKQTAGGQNRASRKRNHGNRVRNTTASGDEATTSRPKLKGDDYYWTISGKLITDSKSAVLRTLAVAYSDKRDKINSIYYNDGPPESKIDEDPSPSRRKAHAKGVVIMDDITGNSIWLSHSTPQFPPPRSMHLEFNENSRKFGQTFMCMNFELRSAGKQIVDHLVNMNPLVYDSQISDRLFALIPDLHGLQFEHQRSRRRRTKEKATTKLAQKIETRNGQDLYIYSKSADFGDDLYAGWIDNELKTTLYVETWRNGAGNPLNSSCPRDNYRVNNVQDLNVRSDSTSKVTWSYHQDHSKWAISAEKSSGYVCISDINRMQSQFRRGGGAVCMRCQNCWSVFSNTILDLEPCPIKKTN